MTGDEDVRVEVALRDIDLAFLYGWLKSELDSCGRIDVPAWNIAIAEAMAAKAAQAARS